jgi:hypothetical protein
MKKRDRSNQFSDKPLDRSLSPGDYCEALGDRFLEEMRASGLTVADMEPESDTPGTPQFVVTFPAATRSRAKQPKE